MTCLVCYGPIGPRLAAQDASLCTACVKSWGQGQPFPGVRSAMTWAVERALRFERRRVRASAAPALGRTRCPSTVGGYRCVRESGHEGPHAASDTVT